MTRLFSLRSALAVLGLSLATAAAAQLRTEHPDTDPDALACAAGVHCRADWERDGLTPTDARIILGLNDEEQARQRLDEVSKQWPKEVWDCAAGGSCPDGMTRDQAREKIPMDPAGIVEVDKRKRRNPKVKAEKPGPTKPVKKSDGITVEVNKPGPSEIVLQSPGQEIQPLDGTWSLVHGATNKSGNCPPMLMNAVGNLGAEADATRAFRFSKPFHPNAISGPEGNWQRVGPNHWRSATTAGGGAGKLTTDLHVMSPSLMQGQIVIEFNIPGQCRHVLTTPYTQKRQG